MSAPDQTPLLVAVRGASYDDPRGLDETLTASGFWELLNAAHAASALDAALFPIAVKPTVGSSRAGKESVSLGE